MKNPYSILTVFQGPRETDYIVSALLPHFSHRNAPARIRTGPGHFFQMILSQFKRIPQWHRIFHLQIRRSHSQLAKLIREKKFDKIAELPDRYNLFLNKENHEVLSKFTRIPKPFQRLIIINLAEMAMSQRKESFDAMDKLCEKCKVQSPTEYFQMIKSLAEISIAKINDPLLAAKLYLRLLAHVAHNIDELPSKFVTKVLLDQTIISQIIESLLVRNPDLDQTNSSKIIDLVSKKNSTIKGIVKSRADDDHLELRDFQYQLTPIQLTNLLDQTVSLHGDASSLHVQRKVVDFVTDNLKTEISDLQTFQAHLILRCCYRLIELHIALNNSSIVYSIWHRICHLHDLSYNSNVTTINNNAKNDFFYYSVLAKMIRFFSKSSEYRKVVQELIENLPIKACSLNPALMEALNFHCYRVGDMKLSRILIGELEENGGNQLTRGQLSSLLSIYLKFDDLEAVEKLVGLIQQSSDPNEMNGVDHVEFNLLITKILYQKDGFDKVWQMASTVSPLIGKSSFITLTNFMIQNSKKFNHRIDFSKTDIMFDRLRKSLHKKDKIFSLWTNLYVKYMCKRSQSPRDLWPLIGKIESAEGTLLNPFTTRLAHVSLVVGPTNEKIVVKNILDHCLTYLQKNPKDAEQSREVVTWCISRLARMGLNKNDLMIELNRSRCNKLRSVGFKDLTDAFYKKESLPSVRALVYK